MIIVPIQMGIYSPFAAFVDDVMEAPAPRQVRCFVSGHVVWSNETPAADIQLRLYGTDDMIEEFVTTDEDGYFQSNNLYTSGQIIKVSYNDTILIPRGGTLFNSFIRYDVGDGDTEYLGEFIIG